MRDPSEHAVAEDTSADGGLVLAMAARGNDVTPEQRYEATRERLLLEHGNSWVNQRPRTYWRTSVLHVGLTLAGGLPLARVGLIAALHAFLLTAFWILARRTKARPASREKLLQTSLVMLLAHTTIVLVSGGIHSPFVPTLFGTVLICANAFGRTNEIRIVLATFVGAVVLIAVLPAWIVGGEWPDLWYRIALAVSLVYSVWIASTKIMETTQVYVRAGAEAAGARDDLLRARSERVSALERMAARVAHDLKNPLAAIAGLGELMARGTTDARAKERLDVMNSECARMESTLRDYLAFSKPLDALAQAPQRLGPIVDRALTLFDARAATAGITLERGPGDAWASVDAVRLEEALLNLIANAIEASARGGTIRVRVTDTDGQARIEVEDEGSGMSADVLARIGTPYFTTRPEGTGLGVALSRSLVKQHGGELTHESERGKGTLARIALPRLAAAEAS